MDPNYFQGTLQLRGCGKDVLDFVELRVCEEGVFVAKKAFHRDGVDLKVSSNKFLMKLKNELPRKFSGKCTLTSRLFSRDPQSSKEVHRLTLLFRMHKFKAGDVIDYRGERVRVMQVGARVTAKSVETGKKLFIS